MRMRTRFFILGFSVLLMLSFSPKMDGAFLSALYQKMRLLREAYGSDFFPVADSIGAEKGIESAMIKYGNWCIRNGQAYQGKEYLERASALGNDTAKCYLAELHYYRENVDFHDPSLTMTIIEDVKIKDGNFLKALMYYDGIGYPKNYAKAFELFSTISEDSFYHNLALYYLAKCYRYGRGVKQDLQKSLDLMNQAQVKPLNARNLEETKSAQFLDIVSPGSYDELVGQEAKNSKPTFELR